jgi:hypothetical protein
MTIDQAIAALEANESDASNGRIDWPTFAARRERLQAAFDAALRAVCIRITRERLAREYPPRAAA